MANRWGNSGNHDRFYFLGLQYHCGSSFNHQIERWLLLRKQAFSIGRKVMANLDHILKSRDITLPSKVHIVQAMGFPVGMCGYENWNIKKAEHERINAFELWCWRRLWRVPWTEGDQTSLSLRKLTLNIHWKDCCWSRSSSILATCYEEQTHWRRPWCWERLRAGEKGVVEDEIFGWHHQLNGHLNKLQEISKTGQPGVLQSMGVSNSWTWLRHWITERLHPFFLYFSFFSNATLCFGKAHAVPPPQPPLNVGWITNGYKWKKCMKLLNWILKERRIHVSSSP